MQFLEVLVDFKPAVLTYLFFSFRVKNMPLKIFQKNEPSSINCIIAVAAGKGGVGKSSVTVNLALALKRLGYSIGILDADIYGPSTRKMLPEDRLPAQKGETLIPALSLGIKLISMAFFRKKEAAALIRAPIANGIITQFIKNVAWEKLDFLLIDFPPGTGDIQLTLSQQINLTGALMVTTPQEVSTLDVGKAMHLFDQVKVPILGVVENMSYYTHPKTGEILHLFGKGGGMKLAKESGVPYLGEIPIDPELCQSADSGTSIFASKDPCPASFAFTDLATKVLAEVKMLKEEQESCLTNFTLEWKEMS